MQPTAVKFKQLSGLLLITGLLVSMTGLVALSRVGILPYPAGLLDVLGSWMGIVLIVLAAKAIFNRRHKS